MAVRIFRENSRDSWTDNGEGFRWFANYFWRKFRGPSEAEVTADNALKEAQVLATKNKAANEKMYR